MAETKTIKSVQALQGKSRNRRMTVALFVDPILPENVHVSVKLKRLIGDWRNRHIHKSEELYSLRTFITLAQVFGHIVTSESFLKEVSPFLEEAKQETLYIQSSFKYEHNKPH